MDQNTKIKEMDKLLSDAFPSDEPGASVIVTKNGETVFTKGYGLANVEHQIPVEPDMVFRIGSISKQFTAISILMLYEQGKLALNDEITKYLPDYPTHGHVITIHHLLTHLSGIKSYTNMPEMMKFGKTDYKPEDFLKEFMYQPMEFAPGEKFNYNNSGYFLLGVIIEKITGMSYSDFVQKNIFDPLGMTSSYYDMPGPIIPKRVSGYQRSGDSFQNAEYLSMTIPYAAGSLASTVEDLAKWDAALYTDKLIKKETFELAMQSGILNNGDKTSYGYGWGIGEFNGHKIVTHSGGINGFICDGIRLPEDGLYAAILTNRGEMFADLLTYRIAVLADGEVYENPESIKLSDEKLKAIEGVYSLDGLGLEFPVKVENDHLSTQLPIFKDGTLYPMAEDLFFIKDSAYRMKVVFAEDKSIKGLSFSKFGGREMKATKLDKPLPSEGETIELPVEELKKFVGSYEVMPGIIGEITLENNTLVIQVPGQPKLPMAAKSETKFFVEKANATIIFDVDSNGTVKGMELDMSGQKMKAPKTK